MATHALYRTLEPGIVQVLFRVVMWVAMVLATPFFAAAITFALFERSFWWIAIPAAMGGLLLIAGLGVWAWAWWWLRRASAVLRRVDDVLDI